MNEKEIKLVTSILGDDFFDSLNKSESGSIFKENTKTATDPEDIKIALQIVPRVILSWLFSNLKYKNVGENIDIDLPFANGNLVATKFGPDNYSGNIVSEGERVVRFKYRSLPAIGLIIMSTFELYDMSQVDEIKNTQKTDEEFEERSHNKIEHLQSMIDERLNLHRLVGSVVDKKIEEREAIAELIKLRLNHAVALSSMKYQGEDDEEKKEGPVKEDKKSKLKDFLAFRESKRQEPIEIDKSENINCPDCDTNLYKKEDDGITLCICYGQSMNKTIKFKKSEDGTIKLKFPKKFDIENIEMILDAIKTGGRR